MKINNCEEVKLDNYNDIESKDCGYTKSRDCKDTKLKDCGDVKSKTLCLCSGIDIKPKGIKTPVVAKIPVVLAEKEVQIDVEAKIKLKEPIYEIKRIKKDVYLTQCKLLPRAGTIKSGVPVSGKLFLSGFIRKNIEYATADCTEKDIVQGRIKHITVDVPFDCVTKVNYTTPPIVNLRTFSREVDLLCNDIPNCQNCEEQLYGKTPCERDFEETIEFTEKPFCELVSARIFEEDIQKDCSKIKGVTLYNKITQRMVVFITIKVLQLQQVQID